MKWGLSFNARSFIVDQTYKMFDLKMETLVTKETMDSRKGLDNKDENNLLDTLMSFNAFKDNSNTLMNIASKDLATKEIQSSLLGAETTG